VFFLCARCTPRLPPPASVATHGRRSLTLVMTVSSMQPPFSLVNTDSEPLPLGMDPMSATQSFSRNLTVSLPCVSHTRQYREGVSVWAPPDVVGAQWSNLRQVREREREWQGINKI
jgi:hypothetical protein